MWIVVIDNGGRSPYGPFHSEADASRFAAFLTAEVDPATVERLQDPVAEVLNWRDAHKDECLGAAS